MLLSRYLIRHILSVPVNCNQVHEPVINLIPLYPSSITGVEYTPPANAPVLLPEAIRALYSNTLGQTWTQDSYSQLHIALHVPPELCSGNRNSPLFRPYLFRFAPPLCIISYTLIVVFYSTSSPLCRNSAYADTGICQTYFLKTPATQ